MIARRGIYDGLGGMADARPDGVVRSAGEVAYVGLRGRESRRGRAFDCMETEKITLISGPVRPVRLREEREWIVW